MRFKTWLWILAFSLPAYGAWIEDSVSVDVDTNDPKLIATSITQFQELLNYLNAENLTSPSRVKVQKFTGRIANYHWENDSQCSVEDPFSVLPVEMSASHADFFYEADKSTVFALDAVLNKADPCSTPPPKPRLRAYKK